MLPQDIFQSLLGYSLKRDYIGDSLNWRNIETFNLEVLITDTANLSVDSNNDNYLSTYIKNQVAAQIGYNKNDITIKSIEVPASPAGKEDLIQVGKYKITTEVRTAIDDATLIAQHPELDTAGSADGEGGKFYGVKDALSTYAKEINTISESFTFNDKEDGGKEFSHTVDIAVRTRPYIANQQNYTSPKAIAIYIAEGLFDNDVNNTYFGHNAFYQALTNFGNDANNKHYFEESYDLKKNKYSFTKKMDILPAVSADYTINPKYSVEWAKDGRTSVTETLIIKSRSGAFNDIKTALPALTANSYASCNSILASYHGSVDGMGDESVASVLSSEPLTKSIAYDEQGLIVTVTTNFTNDPQINKAQITEAIDLSKDDKGIISANYNASITGQHQKKFDADTEIWYNGLTPLDVLKTYGDNALTQICQIVNYSNLSNTQRGVFWNTLSWWWPQGSDKIPIWGGTDFGRIANRNLCLFKPISSSVGSANMGKQWTLNKIFSNDAVYHADVSVGSGLSSDFHNFCPGCFKKVEVKWNDVWPKRIISEHPIIDRGTSWLTMNMPQTSVVSDAYQTEPGRRSVTINAQLARPTASMMVNPIVPVNALRALSQEAANVLRQVIFDENIKDSMQWVFYVSDMNYTYDSDNKISVTAELTYTYKKPPPWF